MSAEPPAEVWIDWSAGTHGSTVTAYRHVAVGERMTRYVRAALSPATPQALECDECGAQLVCVYDPKHQIATPQQTDMVDSGSAADRDNSQKDAP